MLASLRDLGEPGRQARIDRIDGGGETAIGLGVFVCAADQVGAGEGGQAVEEASICAGDPSKRRPQPRLKSVSPQNK